MTPKFKILREQIILRSIADNWDDAKDEWEVSHIYLDHEGDNCLCTQDICECCVLCNIHTGEETIVGNVCVNRFLGIDHSTVFKCIGRIMDDPEFAPVNHATVSYIYQRGWINDWERKFLYSTARKRSLSYKQAAKRHQINMTLIAKFSTRYTTNKVTACTQTEVH
jgi:hypothetical protein